MSGDGGPDGGFSIAQSEFEALCRTDTNYLSIHLAFCGGGKYNSFDFKEAELDKSGLKLVRKNLDDTLGKIASLSENGGFMYPYSFSHKTELPDFDLIRVESSDILSDYLRLCDDLITGGGPKTYDPRDASFKAKSIVIAGYPPSGSPPIFVIRPKAAHVKLISYDKMLFFEQKKFHSPTSEAYMHLAETLSLVAYGGSLFVFKRRDYEDLFLPAELLLANINDIHSKVTSAVPLVNSNILFNYVSSGKWNRLRQYHEISERTDLHHYADLKKMKKVNKKREYGFVISKDGLEVQKGKETKVLDFLRDYVGDDDMTGTKITVDAIKRARK